MDKSMNQTTRSQVLEKLRRRYKRADAEHKRKLIDQVVQLLGYYRKAAIGSLHASTVMPGPVIVTGRPVSYPSAEGRVLAGGSPEGRREAR
jgi:hypothetical protein